MGPWGKEALVYTFIQYTFSNIIYNTKDTVGYRKKPKWLIRRKRHWWVLMVDKEHKKGHRWGS